MPRRSLPAGESREARRREAPLETQREESTKNGKREGITTSAHRRRPSRAPLSEREGSRRNRESRRRAAAALMEGAPGRLEIFIKIASYDYMTEAENKKGGWTMKDGKNRGADGAGVRERLGSFFALPQDAAAGLPRMEMTGNREFLIENCAGIIEYGPQSIRLRAGKMTVRLSGSGLELKSMMCQDLLIGGVIDSVEFSF